LGLRTGVARRALDLQAIEDRLVLDVPHMAWVRAQRIRAIIDLVEQVRPNTPVPHAGDLVSRSDSIVAGALVLAGRAVVSPGQTLTAGQLLSCGGEGRPGSHGEARGHICARVWRQAYREVSCRDLVRTHTGAGLDASGGGWAGPGDHVEGQRTGPFPGLRAAGDPAAPGYLEEYRGARRTRDLHLPQGGAGKIETEASAKGGAAPGRCRGGCAGPAPSGPKPGEPPIEVVLVAGTVGARAALASVEEVGVFRPASTP